MVWLLLVNATVAELLSKYSKFEKFGAVCVAKVENVTVLVVESPPFGVFILACSVIFEAVGTFAMNKAVDPTATLIVPKLVQEEYVLPPSVEYR
jgi:hypothetical protein